MKIVLAIIAVVIVFFVLTGKKRRANKMKQEIYALVRSGRKQIILHEADSTCKCNTLKVE